MENETLSAREWWGKHRFRYNVALVVAGMLAFVAYATIVITFEERIPYVEITGFTIIFQAIGYLIAIGIANIFYFIGPISETLLKPKDITGYRRVTYSLGFWFSVLLPFSIPVMVGYVVYTSA